MALVDTVVSLLERLDHGRPGLLTVLTYHRIAERPDPDDLDPALISAAPDEFARHVAWLAKGAQPVALQDVLDARADRVRLPPRAVLVTFDDAYRDFGEVAWPLLREHGVPATLFVPTAYPARQGHGFWWDRLHRALARTERREPLPTRWGELPLASEADRERAHRALAQLLQTISNFAAAEALDSILATVGDAEPICPVLEWHELRELAAQGVALAPHTRTHARLDRVSFERARSEVRSSRADLELAIGHCPPAFAFPAGGFDERVVALLESEGFELAFTTQRRVNDLARGDWLRLGRANVGRRSTLPIVRAHLLELPVRVLGAAR
jgi:peptidoglycan/xylan/chitin deacetylase (PgdA/CDA1 family)